MHSSPHAHWNEKYLAGHIPWDRGEESPALLAWLDGGVLTPPARVLVPGCGRGHEAAELALRGFSVTALDIAPAALEHLAAELRQIGAEAERVVADALVWRPGQPFDAIYEQTCLCALDPADWNTYAGQLHAWLRPGGHLFALFMQTGREGGPPWHCALPDMRALFPDELWQWPDAAPERVEHPNGHYELACVLTRRP